MSMFKEVADVRTADMLSLPVPKANYRVIKVDATETQKQMVQSFAECADKIHSGTAARTEIMKAPKEDFAVSPSEQLSDRSEERVNPIEESEPSYRQNKKPSIRKKIDDLKKAREKLIKDEVKIPEIITPVKNDIKER